MGRMLKRVPMEFDWPLRRVWPGYLKGQAVDPPMGEGYQLWETTTEGSPVSPVFVTLDELCEWAEKNVGTWGDDNKITAAEWKRMLTEGFVHHREGNRIFI